MRATWKSLCALAWCHVLAAAPAAGATYSARLAFQPGTIHDVGGYRIHVRSNGEAYAEAEAVGAPVAGADGLLSVVVSGLKVRDTHWLAVSTYSADGRESELSNEIRLGYDTAATVVDSDGDGLTDAAEDRDLDQRLDEGETDPENADTDGDGVLDGADHCQGTGPESGVDGRGCPPCASTLQPLRFELGFRRDAPKLRLRASIDSPETIDAARTGLDLEIAESAGRTLYRVQVPASAFETSGTGRVTRLREPWQDGTGGDTVELLKLKRKGKREVVALRGTGDGLADGLPEGAQIVVTARSLAGCADSTTISCRSVRARRFRCR